MPGRRIVLLNMPTEDAEEFVRDLANRADGVATIVPPGAKVEAVVAKPGVWCKCDVPQESRYQRRKRQARRESGWSRGRRFGWWLCVHCNKPSKAVVMHFVTTMLAGCNDLLPEILGTGSALTPTERWREYGGIPGHESNNGSPIPPIEQRMANVTSTGRKIERKRKVRRSEIDRQASSTGG